MYKGELAYSLRDARTVEPSVRGGKPAELKCAVVSVTRPGVTITGQRISLARRLCFRGGR